MPEQAYKTCSRCKVVRPLADFSPDRRRRDGRQVQCKSCRAEDWRRHRRGSPYGLTAAQHAAMLEKPCAICGGVSRVIDHDHLTGISRAALCNRCNVGLGQFGDSAEALRAAAEYLESHAERVES